MGTEQLEGELHASIDEHARALRQALAAYWKRFGKLHPAAFDGHPVGLRPELLEHCRVLSERVEIIRRLRPGGTFAEVGTMFGDFIVKVLDIYRPHQLHLFDLGFQNLRSQHRTKLDASQVVSYHTGDSATEMSKMPDASFDVIYIDADHSRTGVKRDLAEAHRAIKPGGWIVCNDYTNFDPLQMRPYGVFAAVNEFANEHGYTVEYLALAPMGFHDVALRRW